MLPIAWDTITRIVPTIKVRQRKCTRAITHTPYVYGIPRSKILIHAKTRMMLNFLATSFFYIYVMATSFFYIYKSTERPVVLLNAIFLLQNLSYLRSIWFGRLGELPVPGDAGQAGHLPALEDRGEAEPSASEQPTGWIYWQGQRMMARVFLEKRYFSQVRSLQTENSRLTQEIRRRDDFQSTEVKNIKKHWKTYF